jgi:ribonuclease HI
VVANSSTCVIYVDAARDDSVTGIGYTISGEVNYEGKKYMKGHYTSMEAEFHALIEAVRIASIKSDNREKCEIHTDVKPLIHKMRTPDETSKEWREYRASFQWLISKFDSYRLGWCGRENNKSAHKLARAALDNGRHD